MFNIRLYHAGDVAQLVEFLPDVHESLVLTSSTA